MFESIGPVWDGNEVWLVVAAGATFAAFPAWYATMFSGFYLAFLLILCLLILRVVSFEWREKGHGERWRKAWLWANAIGSTGIALIWGIGLANLIHGVPIDSNGDFDGGLVDLFTPYTVSPGSVRRRLRVPRRELPHAANDRGPLRARPGRGSAAGRFQRPPPGRRSSSGPSSSRSTGTTRTSSPSSFLRSSGSRRSAGRGVPYAGRNGRAFAMTALGTIATVATLFTGLYPRVMVSSTDFSNSLDVPGAASAHYTLVVMTVVALIMLPVSCSTRAGRTTCSALGSEASTSIAGRRVADRWVASGLTVRILDKRLVRRARPVRRLLALDVVVGIASAGLVLLQAILIGGSWRKRSPARGSPTCPRTSCCSPSRSVSGA